MATKTDELMATIAAKVIESIEAGKVTGSWVKPWTGDGLPVNASTGKPYTGGNLLWLWMAAETGDHPTNVWATYKQWQALGAQVLKGSKGTHAVKWIQKVCKDHGADEQCRSCGKLFPSTFVLFNAAQVEGYEAPVKESLSDSERIAAAEQFFASIGPTIVDGRGRAYYSPSLDVIGMPSFGSFSSAEAYYATLAHESTHWTGAKARLDRDMSSRFGDEGYAMEELVAELGSAMLCGVLGLADEPRPDHAQYLSSWLKVLKGDPRALWAAASQASKAVSWLVDAAGPSVSEEMPVAA
jgi:antirestriction protein ArdC